MVLYGNGKGKQRRICFADVLAESLKDFVHSRLIADIGAIALFFQIKGIL